MNSKLLLISACVCALGIPGLAYAVDTQPGDVIPAPPGTNGALLYLSYNTFDGAVFDGEKVEGSLDNFVTIGRYVHYFGIGEYTAAFNFLLPYANFSDASLGGAALDDNSGFGDLQAVGTFWFYNDPENRNYAALAGYLTIPTGEYDPEAGLNAGANRVAGTLQLSGIRSFGDQWDIEGIVDATLYGDNRNANGFGGVLEQDPTYTLQTWFNYQASETVKLSLGYAGYWGGDQSIDGVDNGTTSEKQQFRAAASVFVTPTIQILGQFNHDFEVKGGFDDGYSGMIRILKLF